MLPSTVPQPPVAATGERVPHRGPPSVTSVPFVHTGDLNEAQLHSSIQVVDMRHEDQVREEDGTDEDDDDADDSSDGNVDPSPPFSLHHLSLPHPPPAPIPPSLPPSKRSTLLLQAMYASNGGETEEPGEEEERLTVAELRRRAKANALLAGASTRSGQSSQESKESTGSPIAVSPSIRPASAYVAGGRLLGVGPHPPHYALPVRSRAGSTSAAASASLTARSRPLSPAASPTLRPRSGVSLPATEQLLSGPSSRQASASAATAEPASHGPVPPAGSRRPSTASSPEARRRSHHRHSASLSSTSGHSTQSSISHADALPTGAAAAAATSSDIISRSTVYDSSFAAPPNASPETLRRILASSLVSSATAARAMEYDMHAHRVDDVKVREKRLEGMDYEASRANREAQLEALQKLQDEADEVDAHFEARELRRDRRQANGVLQTVMTRDDTAASTVLRGVQGWLELRSIDGAVDERHLLHRLEHQSEETEEVRADAERAILHLIDQVHIAPPLRLELMAKLRTTTHQAVQDRESLVETLKRNLWKARYYLKDAVHGFEGELRVVEGRLAQAQAEIHRLTACEREVDHLLFQKADLADQLATEKEAHEATRRELGELKGERYTHANQLERLEKNDAVHRDLKARATEQITHLTAQLTEALRTNNEMNFCLRDLKAAHHQVTRGWRVKEAQLDAVNEMFRSRRELLARQKAEKARQEALDRQRREAEAGAGPGAAGDDGSSTFLTGVPGQLGELGRFGAGGLDSSQSRRSRLLRPVHHLLSHLSTNRKLYRLLQLHPENAVHRGDMMRELKQWILEAERQLEQAMKKVKEAEANEDEGEGTDGAGPPGVHRSADVEWIRLVEAQQSKFRFLHDQTMYAQETPDQREERERREEAENDELLKILQEEAGRRTSDDDDEDAIARAAAADADSDSDLALASTLDAHPLTSEQRAARLRRALERSTMTPKEAREDRRRERLEWRAEKEAKRQAELQRQSVLAQARIDSEARAADAQAEMDRARESTRQAKQDEMVDLLLAEQGKPSYMSPTGRLRRARTISIETATAGSTAPEYRRQGSRGSTTPLSSPPMSPKAHPTHDRAALLAELRAGGLLDQPLGAKSPRSPGLASGSPPDARPMLGKTKSLGAVGAARGGATATSPTSSKVSSPAARPASSPRSQKGKKSKKAKKTIANFVFADDDAAEDSAATKDKDEEEEDGAGTDGDAAATTAGGATVDSTADSLATPHLDLAHMSSQKVYSFHESIVDGTNAAVSNTDQTASPSPHQQQQQSPSSASSSPSGSATAAPAVRKAVRIDTHDRARSQVPTSPVQRVSTVGGGSKHRPFLSASYHGLSQVAPSVFDGASLQSWPGHEFFRPPATAAEAAERKAEFESFVAQAAHVQMEVWLHERRRKEAERKRHVYVQCPDVCVTREELAMLEHFFDVPTIEGQQQQQPPPPSQQLVVGGQDVGQLMSSSSSLPLHRTIGVQVGIPPAYANIAFYRWYLDRLLSDLQPGRRRRAPIEVEPPWSLYAWLGHDKVETLESATLSAISALAPYALPPTSGLVEMSQRVHRKKAAQEKDRRRVEREKHRKELGIVYAEGIGELDEEEDEAEQLAAEGGGAAAVAATAARARSTDTADFANTPYHPLGLRATDRVLYSSGSAAAAGAVAGVGDGSKKRPVAPPSTTLAPSTRRSPSGRPLPRAAPGEEQERQTDGGLEDFLEGLDQLPDPVDPLAGRLWGEEESADQNKAGVHDAAFGGDALTGDSVDPRPISPSEVREAAAIHDRQRRSELDAIVQLVAQLDRKRQEKEATKRHRREMQEYLDGKRENPPPPLAGAPTAATAATAAMDLNSAGQLMSPSASDNDSRPRVIPRDPLSRPYALYSNHTNIPPSQRSHTSQAGRQRLAAELYSSAILPDAWSYSSGLQTGAGARAMVPYIPAAPSSSAATTTTTDLAPQSSAASPPLVVRPPSPPLGGTAFHPYPFGKVPYAMKPGKVQLPKGLDVAGEYARINAAITGGAAAAVPSTAVPPPNDLASTSWLSQARAQLWAAQEALLLRRKALLRAMVGPARELLVKELGGSVVGSTPDGPFKKGDDGRYRFSKAAASRPRSAIGAVKSAQEVAARKALGKLELYARMRKDRTAAVGSDAAGSAATAAKAEKKSSSALPAVASATPSTAGDDESRPVLSAQYSLLERLRRQDAELRAAADQLETMRESEEARDRVTALPAATHTLTATAPSMRRDPPAAPQQAIHTDVLLGEWKRRQAEAATESRLQSAHDQQVTRGGTVLLVPKPPSIASTAPPLASASANVPPRVVRPQTVGNQVQKGRT